MMVNIVYPELQDKNWLLHQYWILGKSQKQIAGELGAAPTTVKKAFVRLNIPKRLPSETASNHAARPRKHKDTLHNEEWLRQKYLEEQLSYKQIADEIDVTKQTVYWAIKKFNIPSRSAEEGRKLIDQNGENNPNWKDGKTINVKGIRASAIYQKWRFTVFQRDNWECIQCGAAEYLEADHIIPMSEAPQLTLDIDNGQTLCVDCHAAKTYNKSE